MIYQIAKFLIQCAALFYGVILGCMFYRIVAAMFIDDNGTGDDGGGRDV